MAIEVVVDDGWAGRAADALLARVGEQPGIRLCLATGATPLPMYELVAAGPPGSFASAAVLLLDEFGGLAPDEPERCDAVLRRSLVDRVAPAEYRPIRADAEDLDDECRAVDAWIDAGPDGRLDIAVLGLGLNGHLGMNEPGAAIDGRTARVELAATTVEGAQRYFAGRARPTWGMTVGLGDLLGAHEVWVLAAGAAKADIVTHSLRGTRGPNVPASLLQVHSYCTWWLDRKAAAGLEL